MSEARVILAVDGNSLIHRSFHALASSGLRTADGAPVWAVRGMLTQIVMAVERIQPDVVVIGFDDPETSIRREKWPHYKANRLDKPTALISQLELATRELHELGLLVITPVGLEADDVLASVAAQARGAGHSTVIVTSDRDSFALIDDTTSVLRIINGGVDASPLLTPKRLHQMLGIHAHQYQDFAALRGDPSDNLVGVRGIGPKSAAKLLADLGSVRAAFDDLAAGGSRVASAIGQANSRKLADPDAQENWRLNCEIMSFHIDLELDLTSRSGPGILPLAADTVRQVFGTHNLPSTTRVALRELCYLDSSELGCGTDGGAAVEPPSLPQPDSVGWSDQGPPQWRGRRFPKLAPPATPGVEQLALFG